MLLRQLSYAIKNQLKAPKAPYKGLWDEMSPTRSISCLSLVLYGIRELAQQHYEPLILLQSEINRVTQSISPPSPPRILRVSDCIGRETGRLGLNLP